MAENKYPPGKVRDAIVQVLSWTSKSLSVNEIETRVNSLIGPTPDSSVRSYLRLNTPDMFLREARGIYSAQNSPAGVQKSLSGLQSWREPVSFDKSKIIHADCFDWIETCQNNTIHAVVTDPPYGLHEYSDEQQHKLRTGKGGVWRIPPSFDGHIRSPLPRFTTLTEQQLRELKMFFFYWARLLLPKLVPGAHVIVASNPLLSHIVSASLSEAGMERRGEIIRLTMTLRGGNRPKPPMTRFPI